uniref:DUF2052 domain-containing protein n=1 Tax=Panagrellus redivivus TaxID=6233 RepID=A0A7E4VYE3_PANRE
MGDAVQRSFRKRKYGNSERVQHLERMLDPTPAINQLQKLIEQPIRIPSAHVHFPGVQKKPQNFFSPKDVFLDEQTHRTEVSKLFNTTNIDGDRSQVLALMLDDSDTDDGELQPLTLKHLRHMLKIHKKRRQIQTKCHLDPLNTQYKYYGAGLFSSFDKFPEHQKEVIDAFTYDHEAQRRIFEEWSSEINASIYGRRNAEKDREFAERVAKAEADRARRAEKAAAEGKHVDDLSTILAQVDADGTMTQDERDDAVLTELYLHLYQVQHKAPPGEYTQADLNALYQRIHEIEQTRDKRREDERIAREAAMDTESEETHQEVEPEPSEQSYPVEDVNVGGEHEYGEVSGLSEADQGESAPMEEHFEHFDDDQDFNQDDQMDEAMHAAFEHITNSEQGGFLVDSMMSEFDEMAAAAPDGQFHFDMDGDDVGDFGYHVDDESTEFEEHYEPEASESNKTVTPDVFEHYDATWDAAGRPAKTPTPETVAMERQEEEAVMVGQDLDAKKRLRDVKMVEAFSNQEQIPKMSSQSEEHTEAGFHFEELRPRSVVEAPLDLSKRTEEHASASYPEAHPASIEASRQTTDSVESPSHFAPIEFTPPGSEEYHCVAMDFTDAVNVFNPLATATTSEELQPVESAEVEAVPAPRADASLASSDDDGIPGISIGDSDEDFDLAAFVAENNIIVVEGPAMTESPSSPTPVASRDTTPTPQE